MTTNSGKSIDEAFATPVSSAIPTQGRQHQSLFPNHLESPRVNMSLFYGNGPRFSPNLGVYNTSNRFRIPLSHPQENSPSLPNSKIPFSNPNNKQVRQQDFGISSGPSYTRTLSQPSSFSFTSLPPLSHPTYEPSKLVFDTVSMPEMGSTLRMGVSLNPCKAHTSSNSDIPFTFSGIMQSPTPTTPPLKSYSNSYKPISSRENRLEGAWQINNDREGIDDLFLDYTNLENIGVFNSSKTEKKQGVENWQFMGSMDSGSKKNGCESNENEETSIANGSRSIVATQGLFFSTDKRDPTMKMNAIMTNSTTTCDRRIVSIDYCTGNANFGDESQSILAFPGESLSILASSGQPTGQSLPSNLVDANMDDFNLKVVNDEFYRGDVNKTTTSEKLTMTTSIDPNRAKRIVSNRQSVARSKKRKMRYLVELEDKVKLLHTEATTLSSQVTILQRDSGGLSTHNNELKFRLQAMKHEAQLRDAINNSLASELQRLKKVTTGLSIETSNFQRLSANPFQH